MTEAIRFYEIEIKNDPSFANNYKELGLAYDQIYNDDNNFIKYSKKAYELDSTKSIFATTYFNALIEAKKFDEAKKLMQSNNFKAVINKRGQLLSLWKYYCHQENYKKAQEVLKDSLLKNAYLEQLLTYAHLEDRKYIEREFKEYFNKYADW